MNSSKPTMRQIAEAAGVSVATVSHVINGVGRFSDETRDRVERVIDEYGYTANLAARSLKVAETKTIGMIVPDISNDFFSKIALRAEDYLMEQGYSVFVCNSHNNPERERAYFKTLAGKQADGILCISGLNELTSDLLVKSIPVVCIDRKPKRNLNIPFVGSNGLYGARVATEHLIKNGCKNILTISSFTAEYKDNDRLRGYQQALEKYGIPFRDEYRLNVTGKRPSIIEAEALVREFLAQNHELDGIFATSDHAAVGAFRALRAAGLMVPDDVKIAGFDDSVYSLLPTPWLTTVHRFPERMAEEGCKALLQLINGETPALETIIPTELVVRSSC